MEYRLLFIINPYDEKFRAMKYVGFKSTKSGNKAYKKGRYEATAI
jgi:hypothetical protein